MLMLGDCIERMKTLPDCSVDAVVTDPPYGLAFMGKKWDYDVPAVEVWAECLRVLKPGGHLLAFAGTRTQHRMAVRIEDAGFEIRDMIAWVYGSGFPKSLDVSKAIDKAAGAERDVVGQRKKLQSYGNDVNDVYGGGPDKCGVQLITAPATDAARQWQGWGTALKPAMEPITVARKPLCGTVAENVLQHGTGAINVDGCRVESVDTIPKMSGKAIMGGSSDGWDRPWKNNPEGIRRRQAAADAAIEKANTLGRWPANLIHDGSEEVVGLFPQTGASAGLKGKAGSVKFTGNAYNNGEVYNNSQDVFGGYSDSGSAARFFYCAKASKADRDEGCEGLTASRGGALNMRTDLHAQANGMDTGPRRNHHPTVKPTALMRYLCRLVTPPDGIVLDPFMGSGSTGKGAILEGFSFIGIERDSDYMQIAEARIRHATEKAINESQTPSQLELEVANA